MTIRELDNSNLYERFTPYYETKERIEIEFENGWGMAFGQLGCKTDGKRVRCYVGKSTGWKPIYLMILNRNSSGGIGLPNDGIKSIRGLGEYMHRR